MIVTHRTDDSSKLPSLLPDAGPVQAEKPKESQRPKLRLLNAPVPVTQPEKGAGQPSAALEEEWEDVAAVSLSIHS